MVCSGLNQEDPLRQVLLLPQGNLQQIHLDMALWSSGHLEMSDTLGHLKSKEDEENEFSRFRVLSPRETMAWRAGDWPEEEHYFEKSNDGHWTRYLPRFFVDKKNTKKYKMSMYSHPRTILIDTNQVLFFCSESEVNPPILPAACWRRLTTRIWLCRGRQHCHLSNMLFFLSMCPKYLLISLNQRKVTTKWFRIRLVWMIREKHLSEGDEEISTRIG